MEEPKYTRLWRVVVETKRDQPLVVLLHAAPVGDDAAAVTSRVAAHLAGVDIVEVKPVRNLMELALSLPTVGGPVGWQNMPAEMLLEWGYDDYDADQSTPSRLDSYLFPCHQMAEDAYAKLRAGNDDWRLNYILDGGPVKGYDGVFYSPDALAGLTHPGDPPDDDDDHKGGK